MNARSILSRLLARAAPLVVVTLLAGLIGLLPPRQARAELARAQLERIVSVAQELGDLAVLPGPVAADPRAGDPDPKAIERAFAGEVLGDVVINVIAEEPEGTAGSHAHADAVAAAVAAAPALSDSIVARVSRAYPERAEEIQQAALLANQALNEPAPRLAGQPSEAASPGESGGESSGERSGESGDQYAEIEASLYDEEGVVEDGNQLSDPIEGLNRFVFAINDLFDTVVFRPVAALYGFVAPEDVKTAMRHFFRNLNEPVVAANKLLQGEAGAAADTLGRFLVNSTVGGAGFFEVAEDWGLPPESADFGQTLHVWGVGPGPYVVLPLIGPNSLRHGVGRGVDTVLHPRTWVLPTEANLALTAANVVVIRELLLEPLDKLRVGSLDYYTALKSAYWQNRLRFLEGQQGNDAFSVGDNNSDAFENFE